MWKLSYTFHDFWTCWRIALTSHKKDGTREQFSREKILNGIFQSAQKRPVSSDDIEQVVSRIEQKVRSEYEGEVPSTAIGNLVMDELAELDEITYVRFASVYKSFKDVDEIEELLQQITNRVHSKKKRSNLNETDRWVFLYQK